MIIKYNPDPNSRPEDLKEFELEFPSEDDFNLIFQICEKQKEPFCCIDEFNRFGHSGARILLIYFDERRKTAPYIMKRACDQDIKDEHAAIKILEGLIDDIQLKIPDPVFSNKVGALLYHHKGASESGQEAKDPITLQEVLFSSDSGYSITKVLSYINITFNKIKKAHNERKTIPTLLKDHLKDYWDRKDDIGKKGTFYINNILKPFSAQEKIEYLGINIINPLIFFRKLPEKIELNIGRVHGDLHPENIVIDPYDTPCLIDFKWGKYERCIYVDYALLENSIRFRYFPSFSDNNKQLDADKLFLKDIDLKTLNNPFSKEDEISRIYFRLARIIAAIRSKAKDILGDQFRIREYLLVQFIVLYGLMADDTYDRYVGTRYLGMLAKKLQTLL